MKNKTNKIKAWGLQMSDGLMLGEIKRTKKEIGYTSKKAIARLVKLEIKIIPVN